MEADLSVLSVLISNKKYANEFVHSYNEQLFDPDYWKIAKCITAYISSYKEPPTLKALLDKLGKNEAIKSEITTVWQEIVSTPAEPKEFKYNLDKLKKRFAEQELANTKSYLDKLDPKKTNIKEATNEIKKSLHKISDLDKKKTFTRRTVKEAVATFKSNYNERNANRKNKIDSDPGIKTGYSALDTATGGLIGGDLLVVAGESSTGKSLVLSNLAAQMYLQKNCISDTTFTKGQDILYFSLEMPFESCFNRLLARLAGVSANKLRAANLKNDEPARVRTALNFMEAYPHQFEIIDMPSGASIEAIDQVYQEALTYSSPSTVVIDYLGLMSYDDDKIDDWLKLGKIAEVTHEFARANDVTVLSAVQLNRAKPSKEPEDMIGLHRIGRSALIATHVTHLLQIVKRPNEKMLQDMHVALIKNREGACPDFKWLKDLKTSTILDPQIQPGEMEFFDEDDISSQFDEIEDL